MNLESHIHMYMYMYINEYIVYAYVMYVMNNKKCK